MYVCVCVSVCLCMHVPSKARRVYCVPQGSRQELNLGPLKDRDLNTPPLSSAVSFIRRAL